VSRTTVACLAIPIAYCDGFLLTSVEGAVGPAAKSREPFSRWLRDSTLMLPIFLVAIVAALTLTHRWFRHRRRELVIVGAAAALIIVITTGLSITELAVSSASDYRAQSSEIESVYAHHQHTDAPEDGTVVAVSAAECDAACAAQQHATLTTHVRAAKAAALVLLLTNVVLVVWLLAMRGGRLWAAGTR
jgi:hypothetical protein